jgi:TPR repeat protein
MRTSDHILAVALCGLGLGLTTAHALDRKTPANSPPVIPGVGPIDARSTVQSQAPDCDYYCPVERFDTEAAVKLLEDLFRNGDVMAGWKLGHIYADGDDGVPQDHVRAFEIFHAIVERHRSAVPVGPTARFVANAAVTMGLYHLTGIPNSPIEADAARAFDLFRYAAIDLADADGQYHLARAYLYGLGTPTDLRLAARWLQQAAVKGQVEARAELGRLLFRGAPQIVARDIPQGLTWLKIAADAAPRGGLSWIQDWSDSAWKHASEDERSAALILIEQWEQRGPAQ